MMLELYTRAAKQRQLESVLADSAISGYIDESTADFGAKIKTTRGSKTGKKPENQNVTTKSENKTQVSENKAAENKKASRDERGDADERIDERLLDFYNSVMSMKDKNQRSRRQKELGVISDNHAKLINEAIKKATGKQTDVSGYALWIDGSAINHIEDRHGKSGKADQSMQNAEDVARIGWAANNAETAYVARTKDGDVDYSYHYRNRDGSPSPKILLEKSVETQRMIVTECVPDTDSKKIHIISARIKKSDNGQALNIESNDSPQPTSETPVDGIVTTNSIPQKSDLSTENEKNIPLFELCNPNFA